MGRGVHRAAALAARAARLALIACALLAPAAQAHAGCSAAPSSSGEWPMYGHDLANSRSQPAEANLPATGLKAAWVFNAAGAPYDDPSGFQAAPVVDRGCVFIGSATGVVYAIDAADGSLVWEHKLEVPTPGLGGPIVGSAAVHGDEVIELVNQSGGPYAVALDRTDGNLIWQSPPVTKAPGDFTNASPIVADGMVAVGFSTPDGNSTGSGGFALLDASSGAIVDTTPTIPPDRQAQGYAGGGLWSTPAFDPHTGYLYWGSGNPDSKTKEDPNTNAILKIDLNRTDPQFGQIVGHYNGNVDQYLNALQAASQTPACSASDNPSVPYPLDDPVCGQLDLDFGASAQLIGGGLVGDLQKSGVYHAAHADTMAPAWATQVGASCAACNPASPAFDGHSVIGVSTPGGTMYSLDGTSGSLGWLSPIADGVHYQPTSVADGIAYTLDGNGFLDAIQTSTGLPVAHVPILDAVGAPVNDPTTSAGLAVAEHKLFIAATSTNSTVASEVSSNGGPSQSQAMPGSFVIAYAPS